MATVHIIGASISGLAAACTLVDAHLPVKLYEASSHAGGRYRSSSHDHIIALIRRHDTATHGFLNRIGAPMANLPVAPLRFSVASLLDYAMLARYFAHAALSPKNPLRGEWLSPAARVFCHTDAKRVAPSAVRRYAFPRSLFSVTASLQEALIAPALRHIEYGGGSLYYGHELKHFEADAQALQMLHFSRKKLAIAPNDVVLFATPAEATSRWFPAIHVPSAHRAITLAFSVAHREPAPSVRISTGTLYDLVRFDAGKITVMIRPADRLWKRNPQSLLNAVRKDLRRQYPYLKAGMLKAHSIWREANAGHVMDAESMARAVPPLQPHPRCVLAGDWLDPKRPATLESAIASGQQAAAIARRLIDTMRQ